MKLLIYSDLHLKYQSEPFTAPEQIKDMVDIVVILGDILEGPESIDWASREFPNNKVLFVAGDHEYYGGDFYKRKLEIDLRARLFNNITFLDNSSVKIGDFTFHGGTMWTDFRNTTLKETDVKKACKNTIQDFKKIRFGERMITPEDMCSLHYSFKAWLKRAIVGNGKDIVLTHFAPLKELTIERYQNTKLNPYFNPDLKEFKGKVPLWLFGHTHACWDRVFKDTRYISNALGYTKNIKNPEDPNFTIGKIIDLDLL